jgi:hypothetical protein
MVKYAYILYRIVFQYGQIKTPCAKMEWRGITR